LRLARLIEQGCRQRRQGRDEKKIQKINFYNFLIKPKYATFEGAVPCPSEFQVSTFNCVWTSL
jgi:hypothetical protein